MLSRTEQNQTHYLRIFICSYSITNKYTNITYQSFTSGNYRAGLKYVLYRTYNNHDTSLMSGFYLRNKLKRTKFVGNEIIGQDDHTCLYLLFYIDQTVVITHLLYLGHTTIMRYFKNFSYTIN